MLVVCYFVARRANLPRAERTSLKRVTLRLRDALVALLMPAIILGGILTGAATPTEVGVLAVAYGLFAAVVVYREMDRL